MCLGGAVSGRGRVSALAAGPQSAGRAAIAQSSGARFPSLHRRTVPGPSGHQQARPKVRGREERNFASPSSLTSPPQQKVPPPPKPERSLAARGRRPPCCAGPALFIWLSADLSRCWLAGGADPPGLRLLGRALPLFLHLRKLRRAPPG